MEEQVWSYTALNYFAEVQITLTKLFKKVKHYKNESTQTNIELHQQ